MREESEVEAERLALTEELTELGAAKEELFALSNKADLGAQRAQHYMDEARSLAERAQAARAEVEDLERRAQAHGGEIADLGGRLSQLDTEAEARQQAWQQLDSQHDELRSRLVATRQRLDRATADAAGALTRVARLESEIEAAAAKRDDLGNRLAAVGQQDGQLGADAERAAGEQAAAAHRLERLRERQQELADRRSEAEARAATLRQDLSRGEIELDTLREESHRRRSRLQSLSEIQIALRELPAWRAGDHEAVPRRDHLPRRCGRRQSHRRARHGRSGAPLVRRRREGPGGRHRAAAARAGDGGRGGAGRSPGQHHRRVPRGGHRRHRLPQVAQRGAIELHPPDPAARQSRAAAGRRCSSMHDGAGLATATEHRHAPGRCWS